jgi:general secretion pathway protein M
MRRIALTRPQAAAIAALVAMLLVCGAAIGISLQMRSAAADELAERRAVLARLVQASKGGGAVEPARVREAPPEAFIGAPSQGQAGAQLQSYFSRLALDQNAAVASSAVEPPMQEAPDAIRIQATLEISLNALQALLYGLETGTPYLTVDSLSIQAAGAGAQAGMADAPLRVVMMVRGQWRREGA